MTDLVKNVFESNKARILEIELRLKAAGMLELTRELESIKNFPFKEYYGRLKQKRSES